MRMTCLRSEVLRTVRNEQGRTNELVNGLVKRRRMGIFIHVVQAKFTLRGNSFLRGIQRFDQFSRFETSLNISNFPTIVQKLEKKNEHIWYTFFKLKLILTWTYLLYQEANSKDKNYCFGD